MKFTHAGKRLQELLSLFGMHARCGNYSDPERRPAERSVWCNIHFFVVRVFMWSPCEIEVIQLLA